MRKRTTFTTDAVTGLGAAPGGGGQAGQDMWNTQMHAQNSGASGTQTQGSGQDVWNGFQTQNQGGIGGTSSGFTGGGAGSWPGGSGGTSQGFTGGWSGESAGGTTSGFTGGDTGSWSGGTTSGFTGGWPEGSVGGIAGGGRRKRRRGLPDALGNLSQRTLMIGGGALLAACLIVIIACNGEAIGAGLYQLAVSLLALIFLTLIFWAVLMAVIGKRMKPRTKGVCFLVILGLNLIGQIVPSFGAGLGALACVVFGVLVVFWLLVK